MRKELDNQELDQVAGGKAYINGNTNKIYFDTTGQTFKFTGSFSDVRALCESFINKYATEEEYDRACISALKSRGWI